MTTDIELDYAIIFDSTSNGMAITDYSSGKIIDANAVWIKSTGFARENFINRTALELGIWASTAEREACITKLNQNGCVVDFEARLILKGEEFPHLISAQLVEIVGKRHALWEFRDITEHKKGEDALQMMRFSVDRAGDSIFWLSRDGRILYVNDAACAERGYSREEMLGIKIFDLDPDYQPGVWEPHFEELKRRGTILLETRHRTSDGRVYPIEVRANYVQIGGREFNFCFLRDISERKRAENALKESEEQYRSLISAMAEGVTLQDENSAIIAFNKSAERILGLTSDQLNGRTSLDPRWYSIHEDGSPFPGETHPVVMTLKTGLPQSDVIMGIHKPNGDLTWISINAQPIFKEGKTTPYRVVATMHDITERKRAEDEIEHLAFYDSLTQLPNRRLLLDRLNQAMVASSRSNRSGALLFIDLDNFKNLNDTLGHDIGDMLLKQVTQRLESCVREGDTVARLGGDEFVVMLVDLGEQVIEAAAQTEAIGEKILISLSQPYQLDTHMHRCTASIGATIFNGHQQAAEELMKQADIAMYQAKKAGRNALRFFDRQMQESISARVSLEGELHNAIEFRQFHLYYQIQVDSSHRPLGAEALIRWIHPERGLVSPAHFIPLAEENGLILPIGQWVLETACAQLEAWQKSELTRNLTLAINVSAKQFRQVDFVAQVQAAVQRHAINPTLLKLELTESLLQENIEDTIAIMTALNEIGVLFSLDDFGTGYSSLQYLKRLPLDQLKIDQSFVRDIGRNSSDIAVVRAIIAMARSLELDVIAEGVETEEQRQLLLKNGCTHYQGYYFGRPVPIEEFDAILKRG